MSRIGQEKLTKMKCGKKLVLFSLFVINLVDQPAPEVRIEQGIVSGVVSNDGKILQYIGIPYATANSTNRFQAPLPPPTWEGVFKATTEYQCPQTMKSFVFGTENCLRANIYVPVTTTPKPLPVMVYIHGGAFFMGSGGKLMYGPDFIVKHDVILVNINYRLGVLGFLCLHIKEAPGNAGIKDQIAGLRWIKRNIAAFGGDPENITVFGESAGGTSTSLLIASEATDGLFKGAIVQSGSSIANWAINRDPVSIANLLVRSMGHETADPLEMYEILSNMTVEDLVKINTKKDLGMYFDTQLLHLPCVEKPIPGVESAITDLPHNLLRKSRKNIPVIYGSNSEEGLFLVKEDTDSDIEAKNKRYLFASDLEFPSEHKAHEVDLKIKEFYFGKEKISADHRDIVSDLYTQLYFELPEIMEADILLSVSNALVYNYVFNYSGGRNFMKNTLGYSNETGALHADELLYLFTSQIWPFRINNEDQNIINWMTRMWTDFAKFGDPTPTSSSVPIKWYPSKKGDLNFLYIENKLRMGAMPNPEAYSLWNGIYKKYRKLKVKN